jgi:hypothetical protein
MRALRARRPLAVLLVLAAVVVAGCSGDDDDVGTASNDASASSVTADSSASTVAAATAPNATGGTTAASSGASTAAATATTAAPVDTAPGATGPTSGPAGGNGPLATRDLSGQDLCPVLSKDDVSAVVGVPIGLAESNPSYRDPNCVYYKAEAGQAVSVTKSAASYYDQQGTQAESVSGVGDQAKWSPQQLTLFVKAKDATLVISVYQVGQAGGEKAAAVAVAQKVIANL